MNNFEPKLFPTKIGKLYVSPCPMKKDDLEKIKDLKFDCIYNLAAELSHIGKIEETVCPKVILGNIMDYSIPEDFYKFVGQVYEVAAMLVDEKSILVHCFAGHGRSGMVSACIYSVISSNDDAEHILQLAKQITTGPENEKQKEFVRSFCNFMLKIN